MIDRFFENVFASIGKIFSWAFNPKKPSSWVLLAIVLIVQYRSHK